MKRIIYAALACLTFASCEDFLDKQPIEQIGTDEYFKDEASLEKYTNGFLNSYTPSSGDVTRGDGNCDIIEVKQTSSYLYQPVWNSSLQGGWSNSTWNFVYYINTFLERMHEAQGVSEAAFAHYEGTARFWRAWNYFELVKTFGGVPWYDHVVRSDSEEDLYKPRDSREYVMERVLEDLNYACEHCYTSDAWVNNQKINRYIALAIKSHICLFEGTYRKYHGINLEGHDYTYYLEEAAKAAKTIIDEGPYKLYSTKNPDKDYMMLFAQENASTEEYILAIRNSYEAQVYHNATAYTLLPTQGRPGYTRKFINMYLMKDGKAFTDKFKTEWQTMPFTEEVKDRDPRLAQSIRTPGYKRIGAKRVQGPDLGVTITGYQPIKFVQDTTASGGQIDRNDRSTCDMPVFRYAEVLLNYAEAKAELGSLSPDDLNITVNEIRSRVGMPALTMRDLDKQPDWYLSSEEYGYPNVTGSNEIVNAILEIRRERTVELIQEGFRLQDLYRWKAGYCIDQAISGMYFPGPGEYKLAGKETADLILYKAGETKPQAGEGVSVYELGSDIILSEGDKGYVYYHKTVENLRTPFNEERDYLYPIPSGERSLNPNLTQNPGWSDGLDF